MDADGLNRLRFFNVERFTVARQLHHVSSVVGLVRKVLRRLIVVRRPYEPDICGNRKLRASFGHERRRWLHGRCHQDQALSMLFLLQRG